MSLLFRVLFAAACKNTHHRMALDALRHLRGDRAEAWRQLFLSHYEAYLKGAKAPDDEFKDFQNHVLHVRDNYWGGAAKTAQLWYKLTVDALRNHDWKEAVYSAGVLSHYLTDPFMPLHTAQSEAEGKVHRAAEWSVAQSYVELQNIIEQDLGGYSTIEPPETAAWLVDLIRYGAEEANKHYEAVLDHYNLAVGVKDPKRGLDQYLKDCLAGQISLAVAALARVLERAFAEAKTEPPAVDLTLETFFTTLLVPIFWVTKKLTDAKDRAAVAAIYDEVQRTGKVVQTLPDDERTVRRLHAEQVLKRPLRELDAEKPQATGRQHGEGAIERRRSNHAAIIVWPSQRTAGAALTSPATEETAAAEGAVEPATQSRFQKLRSQSLAKAKAAAAKIHLPKLSLARLGLTKDGLSKLRVPKLRVPKLNLSKLRLPSLRRKKAADADVSADGESKPVLKQTGPSDLDGVVAKDAPVRRTDRAAESPAAPNLPVRQDDAGALKFYLNLDSPIESAPSIGPKTARRLEAIGVATVADFLEADPEHIAAHMKLSWLNAAKVEQWQRQATLVCRVPKLRGHDAQLLVGAGLDDAEQLAHADAEDLLAAVEQFAATSEGEKALRGNSPPNLDEVRQWIRRARQARPLQSAA